MTRTETRWAFTHGPEDHTEEELASIAREQSWEYRSEAVAVAHMSGYLERGARIIRIDIATTISTTVED
jgi:molybdopterin synthase catalytic subunit